MIKILIPTDFSLNIYQSIDYVTALYVNEYCEFYFLNTYTYDVVGLNAIELLQADDAWFDEPNEESVNKLGELVEHYTLKTNNVKHAFNAISECVGLVDGIKKSIEKIGIDLVILTSESSKNIGKTSENIIEKIRSCPILIVPSHASIHEGIYLTVVSDFKQKVNTLEIDAFCKALKNTNFEVGILVLEEKSALTTEAVNNLELLIIYLESMLDQRIGLEYINSSYHLKDYAASHVEGIMCVIDEKPDLFRKIGIHKSNVISTLGKLNTNTVLTVHQ
ncbi:hypothetical protein [Mariniflexile sp. AS56]|uniref:hypothetical protein n=1 Tax=Mariniflexile sp. AS56 TaxID=3063957 RepID=UPI0026F305B4|nr:hypothetical protein [Mariniflexile sp. AS56]MDO7172310.1 hypothetical protein [Mariniflexile sp. AS56]